MIGGGKHRYASGNFLSVSCESAHSNNQHLLPSGATITLVILASDKTQLSHLSGDKKAWPVYLTIGNLPKDIRRKPSQHATILIGYLPVSKLDCFSEGKRPNASYQLFYSSI